MQVRRQWNIFKAQKLKRNKCTNLWTYNLFSAILSLKTKVKNFFRHIEAERTHNQQKRIRRNVKGVIQEENGHVD